MLIDNKFLYISIPRCASTSFHISCIKNRLSIEYWNKKVRYDKEFYKIDNMEMVYKIPHIHQNIYNLISEFGDEYEMISVKRDKYERFVSYFNHCIGELERTGNLKISERLRSLEISDLMFFGKDDIGDKNSIKKLTKKFLTGIGLREFSSNIESLIMPIFAHPSYYHGNDPRIIWFDFNNLEELENWVSRKSGIEFKMEKFGSSKEFSSKILVNEEFKSRYDEIYFSYENFKNEKTII